MLEIKILLFISFVFGDFAHSAKIIALAPFASQSHKHVFIPLVEELASRGHEVTFVTPSLSSKPLRGVAEIAVDGNRKLFESFQSNFFDKNVAGGIVQFLKELKNTIKQSDENVITNQYIQSILKQGITYDVALINAHMNGICLLIAPLVAKNLVLLSPNTFSAPTSRRPPFPIATIPLSLFDYPSEMTFFQRMSNGFFAAVSLLSHDYIFNYDTEEVAQKYLPNSPSVNEAQEKISLHLCNADPVMTVPKPEDATHIAVGGIHCRPAVALPKEFEEFVQNDDGNGVIVFSLGSIFPAKTMPVTMRNEFVTAFSQLKQRVIWKFEEPIENLSSNVFVTPWIPQQDILGHPKTRLFITHGGLLSLQESVYHGVPLIGIPLFGDQPGNVRRIMEKGFGKRLTLDDVKAETIVKIINEILSDHRYSEAIKKYSSIIRDQTESPLERAVYWVEYVLRHEGADHFQIDYPHKIQYLMLDVICTLIIIICLSLYSLTYIYKKIKS